MNEYLNVNVQKKLFTRLTVFPGSLAQDMLEASVD